MSLIKKIYNKFKPFNPLPANDPAYVNCSEVRGDENIFREIGKNIILSDEPTCQLYTGHRGVGKSTELLRLKDYLEKNGCFVVYFPATEGDIDELDAQYTDIILACTRNILDQLKDYASPNALLNWLQSRWTELKDLALSDVEFEELSIESQINVFSKLTTTLRRKPNTRETIRKQVDNYSVSLIEALNEFIEDAQKKLPEEQSAMRQIDNFPINIKAVNRAVSEARDITYKNAVSAEEWEKLAKVYVSKNIPNEEEYRSLLFRRCVLEYRYLNEEDNPVIWYDVHPLIEGTSEFKSELNKLSSNE